MPFDTNNFEVSDTVFEVQRRVQALVQKAIDKPLGPTDKETWFFRSDTGTGKTTGFLKAIADSESSFAVAVPTMADVDSIYETLTCTGIDVFKWHSNSGTEKKDGKSYRVVVGTHAFMLSEKDDPTRHIGKKDILIIDEVPSTAKARAVKQSDIVKAREFAEAYLSQDLKDGFRRLEDWVQRRHGCAVVENGAASFHPIKFKCNQKLLDAESEIVGIQDESAKHKLREVVDFLTATNERRAFERTKRTPQGHALYYCWFSFPANNFPKQIVFSATCHLDGLQFSPDGGKIEDEYCGFDVDYSKLNVWDVPYPKEDIPKDVSRFGLRDFEKAYDHLMATVTHAASMPSDDDEILVVCPKKVKEAVAHKHFLKRDLDTFILELELPDSMDKLRQVKIHYTNWGRDVGSNEYRTCQSVILWNNHHKPKHSTLSELFHFSEDEVTPSKMKPVQKGRFRGTKAGSLETDQLYAAIKQMGARGKCRMIDDGGVCDDMNLFISWADLDRDEVQKVFPNSNFAPVNSKVELLQPKPKGIMVKVLQYLKQSTADEVTYKDLEEAGVLKQPRNNAKRFKDETVLLSCHGWKFIQGGRGRQGVSKFVKT